MEKFNDFITYNKRKIIVLVAVVALFIILFINFIAPYLNQAEMPQFHYLRADKMEALLDEIGVPNNNVFFVEYDKNTELDKCDNLNFTNKNIEEYLVFATSPKQGERFAVKKDRIYVGVREIVGLFNVKKGETTEILVKRSGEYGINLNCVNSIGDDITEEVLDSPEKWIISSSIEYKKDENVIYTQVSGSKQYEKALEEKILAEEKAEEERKKKEEKKRKEEEKRKAEKQAKKVHKDSYWKDLYEETIDEDDSVCSEAFFGDETSSYLCLLVDMDSSSLGESYVNRAISQYVAFCEEAYSTEGNKLKTVDITFSSPDMYVVRIDFPKKIYKKIDWDDYDYSSSNYICEDYSDHIRANFDFNSTTPYYEEYEPW